MLRRMSVHAAGLSEPAERYVWGDLSAAAFEGGAAHSYRAKGKITGASCEYAIAGALHLDHLAALAGSPAHAGGLDLAAFQIAGALRVERAEAWSRLERLLRQHSSEWEAFMRSLGSNSFAAGWAMRERT
jgi:hypothetical protein